MIMLKLKVQLHLVSAWATANRLVLGQVKVDSRVKWNYSYRIWRQKIRTTLIPHKLSVMHHQPPKEGCSNFSSPASVPELLKVLSLRGCIVTILEFRLSSKKWPSSAEFIKHKLQGWRYLRLGGFLLPFACFRSSLFNNWISNSTDTGFTWCPPKGNSFEVSVER